jgi:hypothetical protein
VARIRTIKPEFFTSDDVCALSPLARLLFIGCWCEADREGRLEWRPATLKRKYLPEDECDGNTICAELVANGLIVLYGQGLAYVTGFLKHQVINLREAQSKLPEPPETACNAHALPAIAPGKGREGKGKEEEGKVETSSPSSTHSTSRKALSAEQRGTRLPDDWKPTAEDRAFASDLGLDPDVTADEFRDYWTALPGARGRKLNWSKTFKNRCRELGKKPRLNGAVKGETFEQKRQRENLAVIHAYEATKHDGH